VCARSGVPSPEVRSHAPYPPHCTRRRRHVLHLHARRFGRVGGAATRRGTRPRPDRSADLIVTARRSRLVGRVRSDPEGGDVHAGGGGVIDPTVAQPRCALHGEHPQHRRCGHRPGRPRLARGDRRDGLISALQPVTSTGTFSTTQPTSWSTRTAARSGSRPKRGFCMIDVVPWNGNIQSPGPWVYRVCGRPDGLPVPPSPATRESVTAGPTSITSGSAASTSCWTAGTVRAPFRR